MKRRFRSFTAVLLSFVMVALTLGTSTVNAAIVSDESVGATQTEAVNWVNSKIGTWIGSGQCVALINAYANYLGLTISGGDGNACDYTGATNISGTTRINNYNGFVPQPGDICVWGSYARLNSGYQTNYYGHIGIVLSADSSNMVTVECNLDYPYEGGVCKKVTQNRPTSYVTCFIRPNGAEGINFDGINVSNVSFFDAKIGGWMRNPNSYNIRSYGFYFGNNQNALLQYTIGQNVRWTDAYINANLSDYVGRLSQGVQYYYRFFSLTDGYNLSPVYSFTTVGNSTVTFDNITSNNIDNDNMSIECWARNHQGLKILKYGVYYGTAINELNECIEVGNNVYWTDFYVNVKMIEQNVELKPNTTYYYQFFALTDGWNFSSVNSFTTGDYVPLKYSELDVNFLVDGKTQVNIDGIGEIQVYVNGQLQGYGTDFCKNVPAGKPYEVKINITNPDYYFCGVDISDSGYSGLTGISEYNGTKVNLVICKDSGGITDIPSGNYAIVSAIDTKYGLDIAGDNLPANNNDNVILYPIGDAFRPQDIFTITNLGNGYYSINQLNTDMSIDVYGGNTTRFGNISMYQSNNSIAQQWKISYDSLASGYTFQAKCSGMYMTIESGSAEAGKNIYQNIKNDSIPKSQGWVLIPYISADSTILGDANLDGTVSISDVTTIQRYLTKAITFTDEQLAVADTNGDGKVDINDATYLQMYLARYDVVLGEKTR